MFPVLSRYQFQNLGFFKVVVACLALTLVAVLSLLRFELLRLVLKQLLFLILGDLLCLDLPDHFPCRSVQSCLLGLLLCFFHRWDSLLKRSLVSLIDVLFNCIVDALRFQRWLIIL